MDGKRRKLCQVTVFILGWIAYASTYLLRKPLGVLKSSIQEDLKLSTSDLGWFDLSLLLPYAVAQIVFGSAGDYFGSRRTLSLCLALSGASMMMFGRGNSLSALCVILFINGLAQSQCWPNVTKILSTWFSDEQKNTVFGFFGTCAFAGGIIGTALAVHLNSLYGWRGVHYIPSIIVITIALLCFCGYKEQREVEEEPHLDIEKKGSSEKEGQVEAKPSLWVLARLPGVVEISISVFCLKLVRYCMYMWLPMFLEKQLSYEVTEAGLFSTMFEIGGVVGSAALGLILDRYSSSRPLVGVTVTVILSAISLVLFQLTSGWGYFCNSLFMLLAGAFNCGPDTILGAAIPNKIGQQNDRNCGSAVTGIVNGFGSVGTVIEGPVIAWISNAYGWTQMFTMMVILTVFGSMATIKASWSLDTKVIR